MRAVGLAVLILISAGAASTQAQPSCADQGEAARIATELAFSYEGVEPILLCDSQNLAYRTAQAILFLKKISGSLYPVGLLPSPSVDFLRDPYSYFRARIHKIVFSKKCAYGAAMVLPEQPGVMHVCFERLDDLILTSALVHEARHLDGNHSHVVCTEGTAKGLWGCDQNLQQMGSYAVEIDFLYRLSQTEELDREIRLKALSYVMDYLGRHFVQLPFGMKRGWWLQYQSGQVAFHDGVKSTPLFKVSHGSIVQNVTILPLVFDLENNRAQQYALQPHLAPAPIEYKNFLNEALKNRTPFLGFLEMPEGILCSLFKGFVYCKEGAKEAQIQFHDFSATGFLRLQDSRIIEPKRPYILGDNDQMYRLPEKRDDWPAKSVQAQKNSYSLTSLVPWKDGYEMGLTKDGKTVLIHPQTGKAQRVHLFDRAGDTLVRILPNALWSPALGSGNLIF